MAAVASAAPRLNGSQAILKLLNSRAAGSPKDFSEAAEVVAAEAKTGRPLQQFVLALVSRDAGAPPAARLDAATRKQYLDQSRSRIKALAEKGNAMSWYLLSLENNDPALLKKAAEAGNVQAMNAWGTYSMTKAFSDPSMLQDDIEKTLVRSFGYFTDAAGKGDANGFYNQGVCYMKGYGVEEDREKAFNCFKEAAKQGHPEAINNIGGFYRDGLVVERDPGIATKWFKKSADLENPYGLLNYALALQRGEGVDKDEKTAAEYLKRAAEGGSHEAMNAYGMCFYRGIGREKNHKEAVRWFRASARGGVPAAMENLSECYAIGTGGLERDIMLSTVWKIRAKAASGDRNAASWLVQNGYSLR